MPMAETFDPALKLESSLISFNNLLLSPIVGKVAVYLTPMKDFCIGGLYEIWATRSV